MYPCCDITSERLAHRIERLNQCRADLEVVLQDLLEKIDSIDSEERKQDVVNL